MYCNYIVQCIMDAYNVNTNKMEAQQDTRDKNQPFIFVIIIDNIDNIPMNHHGRNLKSSSSFTCILDSKCFATRNMKHKTTITIITITINMQHKQTRTISNFQENKQEGLFCLFPILISFFQISLPIRLHNFRSLFKICCPTEWQSQQSWKSRHMDPCLKLAFCPQSNLSLLSLCLFQHEQKLHGLQHPKHKFSYTKSIFLSLKKNELIYMNMNMMQYP